MDAMVTPVLTSPRWPLGESLSFKQPRPPLVTCWVDTLTFMGVCGLGGAFPSPWEEYWLPHSGRPHVGGRGKCAVASVSLTNGFHRRERFSSQDNVPQGCVAPVN